MTKGIVFMIYGDGPRFLLCCAIWSLRTTYDGPLHVLHYDTDMDLMASVSELPNTTVSEYVPDPGFIDMPAMLRKRAAWCMKAHGHVDQYPFDLNLYYDLDHVWLRPLDMSIFDEAAEHDLVNPWAHYDKRSMISRIQHTAHVPKLARYVTANGGCVCARKGSDKVREWIRLTKMNVDCDNRTLRNNPEEIALGILLSTGQAKALDHRWSAPQEYGDDEDTRAVHCARKGYLHHPIWRDHATEALRDDFLGVRAFENDMIRASLGECNED